MKIEQLIQIIWAISACLLVVLVLLHSPKGDGIGGIGGQAQLFTSAKSAEKTLNRITWVLSITFIALTIVLSAGWLNPVGVNSGDFILPDTNVPGLNIPESNPIEENNTDTNIPESNNIEENSTNTNPSELESLGVEEVN